MPVELLYFSNKSKVLFDFNIILSLYYKDLLTIQNKWNISDTLVEKRTSDTHSYFNNLKIRPITSALLSFCLCCARPPTTN